MSGEELLKTYKKGAVSPIILNMTECEVEDFASKNGLDIRYIGDVGWRLYRMNESKEEGRLYYVVRRKEE